MKKIFISYSHEDAEFEKMLVKQLKVLELEGFCDLWEDNRIQTGSDWFPEIEKAINDADIAVLMVSAGFLTSPFIRGKEVPPILERREKEGLKVLPLFVKPCPWKKVPWLSGIQGFPAGEKSLMELTEPEQLRLLTQFAEAIYNITYPVKKEIQKEPPRSGALFTPLPPRKIKLIGRENDLAALAGMLNRSERVVLVNGLGGIGKTEVCKSFFYTHYNQYEYAAWIDWISTLRESLVRALGGDKSKFIQAAEKDTMADQFDKIIARLRQMRESFLLVVDNIENPQDADLDALASLPSPVKVLANSRSFIEGYEVRRLDYLSPGECRALFYEFYKGKRDDEAVDKIVEMCGYHTMTVELLAKTAHHAGMNIRSLYEALKSKGFNLNEVAGEKVSTFWNNENEKKRFFDHLVKVFDISSVTEEELSVLMNMSVLPAMYIPLGWVREWLKLKDNNLVVSLVEKGWLKRDEETRLYLHPVMQEVVRYRAKPDAKECKMLIISLAYKLDLGPGDNPTLKKEYILYGESVVRALAMEFEEKDEALAALANELSIMYFYIGQLDRALEFQLKALAIREEVLDENHPDLAQSYNNVSMIYRDIGQLDRALEFQLKALAIREEILDKNHPSLAMSYNNVSTIHKAMGQLDRALEFQLKALAIREEILDKNHPDLAQSYNNVSMNYRDMGQLDRALEFQLKALAIREVVLDNNHPHIATSYHNLSLIYRDQNDYASARSYAQKAVAIMQKLFPTGHPNLDIFNRNLEYLKKWRRKR
ncbi:MAG: toll/interleukin-1 receptor domain-containing protein [Candidatus Aminicenantes bacterium]|nr:toll/interleukin-1 receptor domain-containing protein [Candidatus Aminicenantes bacterium]